MSIVRTVGRFDGFLNRIDLGQGAGRFLVLFGAPVAHEDDEERAVACALALRRLQGLAQARIGINTGKVFCGLLGPPRRRDYTVLGDAVNVAARLQQTARPGQALVGAPTRRRAGTRWSWSEIGTLTVRGRSDPVEVHEPVSEAWAAGPGPPSRALPMVGRAAERQQVESLLERAQGGAGGVLVVAGHAGVGKSRFLETVADMAERRRFDVHHGAARSYGGDESFGAWREVWTTVLGLDRRDLRRAACDLRDRVAAADPKLLERVPLVADALDLPASGDDDLRRLPPELRRAAVHETLLALLRARQERNPLLLALEDGQWLDAGSRELLARIAAVAGGWRLLVLVTVRTTAPAGDDLVALGDARSTTRIDLPELPPAAIARLIHLKHAQLSPAGERPPRDLVEALVARAQGNPFYAEELVSFLHERGAGARLPDASDADDVPERVRMLVGARVDALDERDRAVLKVASVIGRRFPAPWLWGSYPALGTPAEVMTALARLAALDLTPPDRSGPQDGYVFKHALAQEAVYKTLSLQTRRALHEGVARYVEETQDSARRQVLDVLAFHYGRSGDAAKGRTYVRRAGDAAARAYAIEPAVAHYRRLLSLLEEADRSDVLIDLGEMLQLAASWQEAEASFRRALEIATREGQARSQARAGAALGGLFARTKDYPQAVRWLERARSELAGSGDRAEVARVLERLAYTCFEQGDYDSADERAREQRDLARELGDAGLESTAIETLGLVSWHRHDLERGRRELEQALTLAETAGHKVNVVHALNDLAGLLLELGRPADAVERLRRAYALSRDIGYHRFSGMIVANVAELHRVRGEHTQGLACAAHALGAFSSLNDVYGVLYAAGTVAMVRREQGALDDADRLLDLVIEKAGSADNRRFRCDALVEQARVHLARGHAAEAGATATLAADLAGAVDHEEAALEARLLLIRARAAAADPPGAVTADLEKMRMLAAAGDDGERANVAYVLWTVDRRQETARRTAAGLYREIAVRTGRFDARSRLAELTGERVDEPAPLPARSSAKGRRRRRRRPSSPSARPGAALAAHRRRERHTPESVVSFSV